MSRNPPAGPVPGAAPGAPQGWSTWFSQAEVVQRNSPSSTAGGESHPELRALCEHSMAKELTLIRKADVVV